MFARLVQNVRLVAAKSWSFLRPKQKLGLVSFVFLATGVIVTWFILTPVASAGIVTWIRDTFADLFFALAGFLIKLTFFVLKFIIEIAGYNGYIDSPAVTVGWVMVRDLTNMFFIVVMLVIAFSTILGIGHFEFKQMLVKLVIAAIIVNFSRIICGIIIDIAQVVMMTFVNGIAATASGNIVNMFNVQEIFKLGSGSDAGNLTGNMVFLASVAALVFGTMMLVTMSTFLILLVGRMAMLWVLIVLSPLAFVFNVLEQTEKYAHEWWEEFNHNVISGPIVVFFLWLSFVTVGTGAVHDEIKKHNGLSEDQQISGDPTNKEEQTGITDVMSWTKMANFVIAIAMLLAGAKMAEELGVIGGHAMGAAKDIGKKVAMYASGYNAARWGAGKAVDAGKFLAMKAPVIGGDAWNRRGRRLKAWASYKTTKRGWFGLPSTEQRLIAAGKRVDRAYGKEEQNIAAQPEDVQELVANRNEAMAAAREEKDEEKRKKFLEMSDRFKDQLKKKGYGVEDTDEGTTGLTKEYSTGKKLWARMGLALWTTSAFHEEYTNDAEKRAELAHEEMEHIVSTSKTPLGKEKTRADSDLHELEETGGKIKKQKLAAIHEKKHHMYDKIEAALKKKIAEGKTEKQAMEELRGKFSDRELFDYSRGNKARKSKEDADQIEHTIAAVEQEKAAKERARLFATEEGREREHHEVKAKAEAKQIEDRLTKEKELEELKAIRKLLSGKGANEQNIIDFIKAQTDNIKEDFDLEREEEVAKTRAEAFRKDGDELRANQVVAEFQSKVAKKESDRVGAMSWEDKTFALEALPAKLQQLEADIKTATGKDLAILQKIKNKTVQRAMALQTALRSEGKEAAELGDEKALLAAGWDKNEVIDDSNRMRAEFSKILGRVVKAGEENKAAQEIYDAFGGIEKAQGALTLYSNANKSVGVKGAGALFGLVGEGRNKATGQLERFFGNFAADGKTKDASSVNVGSGFYPTTKAETDHRKWITANGYARVNVKNEIVGFTPERAAQLAQLFQGKNQLFISQMQNGFFDSLNSAVVAGNEEQFKTLLREIKKVLTDTDAVKKFDERAVGLLAKVGKSSLKDL